MFVEKFNQGKRIWYPCSVYRELWTLRRDPVNQSAASFTLLLSLYPCFSHTTKTPKVTGCIIYLLNPFLFMYHRDQLAHFISFSTPILKVGNQLAHHQVGQMAAIDNLPLFVLLVQFNRLTSRGRYWILKSAVVMYIYVYIYIYIYMYVSAIFLSSTLCLWSSCATCSRSDLWGMRPCFQPEVLNAVAWF